jgi:hypothetical protein
MTGQSLGGCPVFSGVGQLCGGTGIVIPPCP